MELKLKQIKSVGFVLKPNAPEIKPLYEKIVSQIESRGIEVLISNQSAEMIDKDGMAFSKMCEKSDVLISLGGDGTLLSLVRRSYGYDKPVLGIRKSWFFSIY